MSIGGIENRLYSRKIVDMKVVFDDEFGEGLIYVYANNISLGGLFLKTEIPIKIGSYVFLNFELPKTRFKIRATGQIVRASLDKEEGVGIGVRFVGLSEEAIKTIEEYLL